MKKTRSALILFSFLALAAAGFSQPKSAAKAQPLTLPIATKPTTLKMFVSLDAKVAASRKSMAEIDAVKELEKRTGIKIEFLHPASNQVAESLNLMLASNQLPDMFSVIWSTFPGGFAKLYNAGQIIDVRKYVNQYAPNLMAFAEKYPDIMRDMYTDTGEMIMIPELRLDDSTLYFEGFMIRNDWLKKVGLAAPTTVDELYKVLTAFKTRDPNGNGKADELPFVSGSDQPAVERMGVAWGINTAWQVSSCMYVENGKVKFGPAEAGPYKDYLATMNKWYKEGLIDPDFLSSDAKGRDAKMVGELGGMTYGKMNGQLASYMAAMKTRNPSYDLTALMNPKAPDGKSYDMYSANSRVSVAGIAISSQCKDPAAAVKWIDYLFSPEGIVLSNFGIEGLSYTMKNGKPVYTELVTKNPDKLSLVQAIAKYSLGGVSPRMVNDVNYWEQVMQFPQQKTCYTEYSKSVKDKMYPPVSLTASEFARFSSIIGEARIYVEEMSAKFIMGEIPLSQFDSYLKTLRGMRIQDAVAVQQAAYDRYLKR